MTDQTIVALATAAGESAIHLIRLSGSQAEKIIERCFQPKNKTRWQKGEDFTLHLGYFFDGETKIDQVLISRMRGPRSYTGEDLFEINCHGGMLPVKRILAACLRQGACLAMPGEFTKRAFLNGKLDLIQAEAIIDLIGAKTELSADLALNQMSGDLSLKINEVRQEILDILAYIEASIDFPEDETDNLAFMELSQKLEIVKGHLWDIFKSGKTGKMIREGLSTVIAGKPNVGKSSLLNALLKEERAIVTDIPGTTRDEIHEYVKVGEVLLHLIDTAGIRESEDPIEIMGIERTWKALNLADVILLLLNAADINQGLLSKEERTILEEYPDKTIVLVNKTDLCPFKEEIRQTLAFPDVTFIPFSVKKEIGFEVLEKEIFHRIFEGEAEISAAPLLANIRQIQSVENCLNDLEKAVEAVYADVPFDLISIDVRRALEEVSSVTGHQVQEELLEHIFSKFCIGK